MSRLRSQLARAIATSLGVGPSSELADMSTTEEGPISVVTFGATGISDFTQLTHLHPAGFSGATVLVPERVYPFSYSQSGFSKIRGILARCGTGPVGDALTIRIAVQGVVIPQFDCLIAAGNPSPVGPATRAQYDVGDRFGIGVVAVPGPLLTGVGPLFVSVYIA